MNSSSLFGAFAIAMMLAGSAAAAAFNWGDENSDLTSGPQFVATKQICRNLKPVLPPQADMPNASTAQALAGCDSEALYYGIGMKPDPGKARQCAFVEMSKGDDGTYRGRRPGFSGPAILMTIYANGKGAKRDLDVATALACQLDDALATDSRIKTLQNLKQSASAGDEFSWCDDATSGFAAGACAAHDKRIADVPRNAREDRLFARWHGAEQRLVQRLRAASRAFIAARVKNEVDLSGTARAEFQLETQSALQDEFLDAVEKFGGDHPPAAGTSFVAADAMLNQSYRDIMDAKKFDFGTVTQAGIRETERAWLQYRDAFAVFFAKIHPGATGDGPKAWLTLKRNEELTAFGY